MQNAPNHVIIGCLNHSIEFLAHPVENCFEQNAHFPMEFPPSRNTSRLVRADSTSCAKPAGFTLLLLFSNVARTDQSTCWSQEFSLSLQSGVNAGVDVRVERTSTNEGVRSKKRVCGGTPISEGFAKTHEVGEVTSTFGPQMQAGSN